MSSALLKIIKGHNGWIESFRTKCLLFFGPLASVSEEIKAISSNQNFVLFLNKGLEILCWFLFEISKAIFERPKKLVWTVNPHVFAHPYKSLSEVAKNCRSWSFCRAADSLQNVISN